MRNVHLVYDPFWRTLKLKHITQYRLIHQYGISSGQLDRMRKNQYVTTATLKRLCEILRCELPDLLELQDEAGTPQPFRQFSAPEPRPPAPARQTLSFFPHQFLFVWRQSSETR